MGQKKSLVQDTVETYLLYQRAVPLYSCWLLPSCPLMMLEETVNDAEEKRETGKTERRSIYTVFYLYKCAVKCTKTHI